MNICIFTTSIDKKGGGPARSVPILAKGLSQVGVETTLLTGHSAEMNTHLVDGTSVKIKEVPKNISTQELECVILNGHFDLIHGQNLWMPFYNKMARIARKHGIPYMMTPRGCLEPWCMKQKRLKKLLAFHLYQKKDLQNAACILATAQMEADNIRDLGINAPIAIIPNGIDVSEYECRPIESKENVKKQIVFLSRIHEKKGIEYLIEAWQQLNHKYSEWNVVIAGNGEDAYINHLKDMIANKGLESCVKIIPPVFGEAKHELYCESSLFVLPTYSENFGMVIAEAMSCGVPVITTNGTPWQELNKEKLGWCIDLSLNNLVKTLCEAIDSGLDNLFEMGQRCSKHIHDTYQYTMVAEKNKKVYEWIVNGGPKPDFVQYP